MKKIVFTAAMIGFAAMTTTVLSQDTKGPKGEKGEKGDKGPKESQEIIIRKKGDKDTRVTVEINGDKITVNGKPLSEFKDDEISINKRNVIIREGRNMKGYTVRPDDFNGFNVWSDDHAEPQAFLGVTTEDAEGGAKVTEITKESAAAKAGLKEGDIITKVADKKVDGPGSLYDAVSSMKPKTEVTVYYKRDGKESSVKATLGERKVSNAMAYSFSGPDGMTRSYTVPRVKTVPGIEWNDKEMGDMSPKVYGYGDNNYNFQIDTYPRRQRLGLKIQDTEEGNGVKVLGVDTESPAEKAGLKKDDIVTEISGKKVSNTDEAREQLLQAEDKSAYNIKATRNGSPMSFDIKIPKKLKTANL